MAVMASYGVYMRAVSWMELHACAHTMVQVGAERRVELTGGTLEILS